MEKITVLITDDHTLVRETLTVLLNSDPGFNVVASAGSGEEAIILAKQFKPDIILMDINLPGMNGIEATRAIRKAMPVAKVIGLSMHSRTSFVHQMLRHGASGYVSKNSPFKEMCKAIIEIHNNRRYICDEMKDIIANVTLDGNNNETQFASVSEREIEVIEFIKKGLSSKEIADCLKLSIKTIEAHRYNVMKRLKLKNVAALVNYFSNSQSVSHASCH